MSNLTDLVPPLELCKLIPAGEFEDTAFQWQEATIKGKVCVDIIQHYPLEWKHPEWANLYPAPTLQEIQASMPHCSCRHDHLGWTVVSFYVGGNGPEFERNPTTAALKLWLELKGSEHER